MEKKTLYKTIFCFEVLSEEPINQSLTLEQIAEETVNEKHI
jgi:hypothetical protein